MLYASAGAWGREAIKFKDDDNVHCEPKDDQFVFSAICKSADKTNTKRAFIKLLSLIFLSI